jgi:hypothetical protein
MSHDSSWVKIKTVLCLNNDLGDIQILKRAVFCLSSLNIDTS